MVESTATPGTSAAALTFTFSTQALRVVTIDGEPWFCAGDVCDVLGYANSRKALADHCRAPGVTKRDMGVITGKKADGTDAVQQVSVAYINEGNLYRLCIKSHKPEAQKFEAWVCDEVLPAIRKTGRYVASNAPQATTPPPASVAEYLSGSDLLNIKRNIWFITRSFNFEGTWVQAIWFYLRQITGVPSPHQFNVDHLPAVAFELNRAMAISWQVQEIIKDIEHQAARRIFRKGELPDVVLADLKRQAELAMLAVKDDVAKLPSYFQSEQAAIAQRKPHFAGVDYGTDEKAGHFSQNTQGAAA